jgi:hypothetical protein
MPGRRATVTGTNLAGPYKSQNSKPRLPIQLYSAPFILCIAGSPMPTQFKPPLKTRLKRRKEGAHGVGTFIRTLTGTQEALLRGPFHSF